MHIQEIKIKKSSSETWSSLLLTLNYFTLYSSVPIVEFEKVIVFWVYRWSSACFSYFRSNIKIRYFIVLFMKIIKNNSNIYFISTLWEISNGIFDTIFFTLKSHKQRQWFVDVLQNMYFEKTFEFGLNTERYRIQTESGKYKPEKTTYLDTFQAVWLTLGLKLIFSWNF